jgi:magnesium-protoporphyrin O-methyltransferase
MNEVRYLQRRGEIEDYFDRTAARAWANLTSTAPVGRIRASVRAGRDEMRSTLMSWLPTDLRGLTVLDAGCGTGQLAIDMACRGAHVVGIDLSPTLITLARERIPKHLGTGSVEFHSGDMLAPFLETFDYVVAMDSLIHYEQADMVKVLEQLCTRVQRAALFTFVPRTPALALMHSVGRLFPRGNRSPSIQPVSELKLRQMVAASRTVGHWPVRHSQRVSSGFYTSQAMEICKP